MSSLITNELFQQILIEPVQRGAKDLYIVTGYASPSMVTRHFEYVAKTLKTKISIDLHVGMTGRDGLSRNNLLGMQAIPRQSSGQNFNCSFSVKGTSNHSKVYVWCSERGPVEAFLGSNNFTQFGFGLSPLNGTHTEVSVRVDPEEAFAYVLEASKNSIGYQNTDIPNYIDLFDESRSPVEPDELDQSGNAVSNSVLLPLIQLRGESSGDTHQRSGLNWGQREGREPNQAYIPIPSSVARSNFFPPKGVHFQVTTSDGQAFICTVAQDGDKALETPFDNSILGKYIRQRLGLELGSYVTTADLNRFGSNAVKITRFDNDSYQLNLDPGLLISPAPTM